MTRARVALSSMLLAGCAQRAPEPTQIVVRIEAEREVAVALAELRVAVRPTDTAEPADARVAYTFALARGAAGPKQVRLPFSYGMRGRGSERVRVVIEGYAQASDHGEPLISHKVDVRFAPGETRLLPVWLRTGCLAAEVCEPALSCRADADAPAASGVCTAVDEPPLYELAPGEELPALLPPAWPPDEPEHAGALDDAGIETDGSAGLDDAGIETDAGAELDDAGELHPVCPPVSDCVHPEYPCIAGEGGDYACSGQFAMWRVPPPADLALRWDTTDPDVAVDALTGLVWQRAPRAEYPACRGEPAAPGAACSLQEAIDYCRGLTLAGLPARLPSFIELASLLELERLPQGSAIDPVVFGEPHERWTWSRSTSHYLEGYGTAVAFAGGWWANTATSEAHAVRCVAGAALPRGTPRRRYRVDVPAKTVEDTQTGLTWRREPTPVTFDWEAAQRACEPLGAGFRVPTYPELLTLVDPTGRQSLLAPEFEPTPLFPISWTSTLSPNGNARYVSFAVMEAADATVHENTRAQARARAQDPDTLYGYEVRCVRQEKIEAPF